MAEDKRISNQRYRCAFMRGFERGCTARIGQYSDYKDVHYTTDDKDIQNKVVEAYDDGYKYGYEQRQVAHAMSNTKYPWKG